MIKRRVAFGSNPPYGLGLDVPAIVLTRADEVIE
jgi:hypothetical protein